MYGDIPPSEKDNPNLRKFLAIRNVVTSHKDWKRILLYEVDSYGQEHINTSTWYMTSLFHKMKISFIVYRTKNGIHGVALTPITATQEGAWHDKLQDYIPEYYSGTAIRVSLKPNEKQELLDYSLEFPYCRKLTQMYCRRFNIPYPNESLARDYNAVFEKYWTTKQT